MSHKHLHSTVIEEHIKVFVHVVTNLNVCEKTEYFNHI